ncbi:aldo/keto reductase [Streptococcus penaeicida]|uniref:Aldo/keto reductase n=1 Tax=Streptococcus penaeicida TaxID=1765960 RepID=A0A2N8LAY1_9STRE|nr:aldo/keto reductase [Streptococcus penaeicida]PND47310.1 aldo/keto reductase [Streptococcus penaeicida]
MEYTRLGQSGLLVSKVCLGTMGFGTPGKLFPWTVDEEEAEKIVKECLDLGINFFDTANIYTHGESEQFLGRALKKYAKRQDVVIATKCGISFSQDPNAEGLSRKVIFDEVEKSLKNLDADYIDLYIVHRPDMETPVEETMKALHDLVEMGKVRYIGASNMKAWQFAKYQYTARIHGWTPFISLQNEHHILSRKAEEELFPMLEDMGVSLTAYKVLVGGRLTRKENEVTERAKSQELSDFEKAISQHLQVIADRHNCSKADVLIAWELAKKPIDVVLVGTTKVGRMTDTVKALEVTLTEKDIEELNSFAQGK